MDVSHSLSAVSTDHTRMLKTVSFGGTRFALHVPTSHVHTSSSAGIILIVDNFMIIIISAVRLQCRVMYMIGIALVWVCSTCSVFHQQ